MAADNEYDAVRKDFVFEDAYRACALSGLAPTGCGRRKRRRSGGCFRHALRGQHAVWRALLAVEDDGIPWGSYAACACSLCTDDKRYVFARPADLWRDHLFEALLQWVNETLAPVVAIALALTPA